MKAIRSFVRTVSTLDLRSVGLFRIALGFMVVVDLVDRLPDLRTFYTDFGILPRWILFESFDSQRWILHAFNGATWFEVLIFGVHVLFALALMVGYRSRAAALGTWILTLSMQGRQPQICYCGDVLVRMLLLWACFLPLGERFSFDRVLAGKRRTEGSNDYTSLESLGILLLIASVYICTGVIKNQSPIWHNGRGIYYAVTTDAYATALGEWLSHQTEFLRVSNFGVLLLEALGTLGLFIPWRRNILRIPTFLAFVGLHVGMGATLCVTFFQAISIAAWTVVLPQGFWDFSKRYLGGLSDGAKGIRKHLVELAMKLPAGPNAAPTARSRKIKTALAAAVILQSIYWNAITVNPSIWMPEALVQATLVVGVDQRWDMFARPFAQSGWFVIPARLSGGKEVDLFRDGSDVDWKKPERVSSMFRDERWRKLMFNLLNDRAVARLNFARYLCRSWNEDHSDPAEKLEAFKIVYRKQVVLDGGEKGPPMSSQIWQHECGDRFLEKWGAKIAIGD